MSGLYTHAIMIVLLCMCYIHHPIKMHTVCMVDDKDDHVKRYINEVV